MRKHKTVDKRAGGSTSISAAEPSPNTPRALILFCGSLLLVLGLTLFAHWPVLSARAVSFDDEEAITRNHLIQTPGWHSVGRFFREIRLSSVVPGYYRPLTLTSLMLDWSMGGRPDNFYPFHRTSLGLHLVATALVTLLCYLLFHQPLIAAVAGLLFGVHPLTVEPIAWVMERKTLLAGVFAFAALCAYIRFAQAGRRGWFLLSLAMFLFSLLAKPTATPLPLMMILIDYWPLRRLSGRTFVEKLPFIVLAVLFAALTCACENPVNPLSLPARLSPLHLPLRLCWLVTFYSSKVVFPMHLSSVYLLPSPLSLFNPLIAASVAAVVLMAALLMLSRRWTPAVWVGASCFFLALAPTMGFIGYSWVVASDKYMYLPSVGVLLIVCGGLEGFRSSRMGRTRTGRLAVGSIVVISTTLLISSTRSYLSHWQTTEGFIEYMLTLTPESPELLSLSGSSLLRAGHPERAIPQLNHAISLQPTNAEALVNRSIAYGTLGDYSQAVLDATEAIKLHPSLAEAFNARGAAYGGMGEFEDEIRDCTRAIELRPELVSAYNNRSLAFRRLSRFEEAIRDSTTVIELMPGQPSAYRDRGTACFLLSQLDRAIDDFSKAIELDSRDAVAFRNRGSSFALKGEYERAVTDFTAAISLRSNFVEAYQGRAAAYYELKQYDAAWADLDAISRLGATIDAELLGKLRSATSRTG